MLFALPEYETAARHATQIAIEQLARARSPLLSRIRSEPTETVPTTRIRDEQGGELELEVTPIRIQFEVEYEPLVRGELGPLFAAFDAAAGQHERAIARALFSKLDQITEMTGNRIEAGGQPISWDLIADMLQTMEIAFDDDGKMDLTLVTGAAQMRRLEEIGPPSREQEERLNGILAGKRDEWLAKKRRRRLGRQESG